MKIIYEEKDINNMMGFFNKNSFLRLNAAQSGEKWGLPIFKRLKFNTEAEVWKDPRVKQAAEKAKDFCNKKGWTIPTPDEAKTAQTSLFQGLSQPNMIAKGMSAKIANPRLIKYNGLLLATCSCSLTRRKILNKTLGAANGAIYGNVVGALIGAKIASALTKKGLFSTYVGFKKPNGSIKWYLFGYFLVGDIKDFNNVTVETAKESLQLSLEDLILGEGIGDAAEKTTVEGDIPDPKAPETPTNDDENEVEDVGGEVDDLDNSDGDYVCTLDWGDKKDMTPEEAKASIESLLMDPFLNFNDSLFMI